jgi:hydroxymethylpyrimidine/phosphomethylpyrimidine kinase
MVPAALTIAGSDPSGGAGLQADLKTFHRFGVYGQAVVTLITVQNSRRLSRVNVLDAGLVREQIEAVVSEVRPGAAKVGALGNAAVVDSVARAAESFGFPLVVDPVLISSTGTPLLDDEGRRAMAGRLLPRAFLLMPNLDEAAALAGFPVSDLPSMRRAAEALAALGAQNVLVKGGHLAGDTAVDLLFTEGRAHEFAAKRVPVARTHGTGCTYSAAITAELAKGTSLPEAVNRAKEFVRLALETASESGGLLNFHAGVDAV